MQEIIIINDFPYICVGKEYDYVYGIIKDNQLQQYIDIGGSFRRVEIFDYTLEDLDDFTIDSFVFLAAYTADNQYFEYPVSLSRGRVNRENFYISMSDSIKRTYGNYPKNILEVANQIVTDKFFPILKNRLIAGVFI